MSRSIIRFDRLEEGSFQKTQPRLFEDAFVADHGTLCRAFGLDPIRTKFDLPSSWRGTGSDRGDGNAARRRIRNGLVLFHDGRDYQPIGKVTIMREGERVRDDDPMNPSDFYDLDAMR